VLQVSTVESFDKGVYTRYRKLIQVGKPRTITVTSVIRLVVFSAVPSFSGFKDLGTKKVRYKR